MADKRTAVLIDEIDLAKAEVHARDKHGGAIRIPLTSIGAVVSVPMQGEWWTASQADGTYTWVLESRIDNGDEKINELVAGDTRVRASETLHLEGEVVKLNGFPVGSFYWDRFASAGTALTLTYAPIGIRQVQAFRNGTLIDPNSLALSGKTLTIPAGGGLVVVYYEHTL